MPLLVVLALVAAMLSMPATCVRADDAAPAGYQAAIDEAVSAFAAQDWPVARASFARAHDLAPSARTFRGLGLSLFYLRDYAAAREAFESALTDTRKPLSAEQAAEVERFLRSTKLETGRYELRVSPSSAQVTIDGVPRDPGMLLLARGAHVVEASAAGFEPHRQRLAVDGGEDSVLEIALAPPVKVSSPAIGGALPPAAVTRDAAPAPAAQRSRLYTWIALGAAPVFAGIGSGLWLAGKSKFDDLQARCETRGCTYRQIDDAHLSRYSTWSAVSFATAGAALAGGVVLFFVEGRPEEAEGPTTLAVSPSGISLRGAF